MLQIIEQKVRNIVIKLWTMHWLSRLFTEHPASIGETYFEHMGRAAGFAFTMLVAGVACLIHALLPFLFVTTGSRAVTKLHDRMVQNRNRHAPRLPTGANPATSSTSPAATRPTQ